MFITHTCIEYYCHFWSGASAIGLEIIDHIQSRICNITYPDIGKGQLSTADRAPGKLMTDTTEKIFFTE